MLYLVSCLEEVVRFIFFNCIFRVKVIYWMDEWVKVMNEIIVGMCVIKMYIWEDLFLNWIR